LSPVGFELAILQMQARDSIVVLLDEWDRRLADGGSEMADIKVDPVVLGLGQGRVPTIEVHLSMVVVTHPDLALRGVISDTLR
jgi:hypothetical protein